MKKSSLCSDIILTSSWKKKKVKSTFKKGNPKTQHKWGEQKLINSKTKKNWKVLVHSFWIDNLSFTYRKEQHYWDCQNRKGGPGLLDNFHINLYWKALNNLNAANYFYLNMVFVEACCTGQHYIRSSGKSHLLVPH